MKEMYFKITVGRYGDTNRITNFFRVTDDFATRLDMTRNTINGLKNISFWMNYGNNAYRSSLKKISKKDYDAALKKLKALLRI